MSLIDLNNFVRLALERFWLDHQSNFWPIPPKPAFTITFSEKSVCYLWPHAENIRHQVHRQGQQCWKHLHQIQSHMCCTYFKPTCPFPPTWKLQVPKFSTNIHPPPPIPLAALKSWLIPNKTDFSILALIEIGIINSFSYNVHSLFTRTCPCLGDFNKC